SRESDQFLSRFRSAKRLGAAHDLIEFLQYFPLLIDEHFRVPHDVDEQDVRDLERDLFFYFCSHWMGRIVANPWLTSSGEREAALTEGGAPATPRVDGQFARHDNSRELTPPIPNR